MYKKITLCTLVPGQQLPSGLTKKIIMRLSLTISLLTLLLVQVWATGYSQVTLDARNASLESVLRDIRQQTGVDFIYDAALLEKARPVDLRLHNATLEEALNQSLARQPLTYTRKGNAVVIKEKTIIDKVKDFFSGDGVVETQNFASLQETITGRVVDSLDHPLQGASIRVVNAQGKRTNIQALSDNQGNFSLANVPEGSNLEISYLGHITQVVRAEGNIGTINLAPSSSPLDEVQVIAYGTTTKRYNLGSVTTVKAEDIEKQPVTNPLAALQGRVPGLVVTGTSGLPGSRFNVQIRGQNTLKNSSAIVAPFDNPLFIIDGVPFSPQNDNINQMVSAQAPGTGGAFNNPYGGFSPFNSINPSDIESIEVLRDADATSIYGSRGGNGVILITTKKGKEGKTNFQFDMSQGISFVGETMRMMNTSEYLSMRTEALANGGLTPNLTLWDEGYAPDLLVFDQNRYTNWQDFFLGSTAQNTLMNTSLSGGSRSTQFRIGTGFNRNTYVYPGNYADNRINFLVTLNHKSPDEKLNISFSSNYSYNKNNSSGSRELLTAYVLEPNFPNLTDQEGNLIWEYEGQPLGYGARDNPLTYLNNTYEILNKNLISNLQISYELLEGLTAKTSLGYNTFYNKEYFGNPQSAQNPVFNSPATASFGRNDFTTLIVEPQIEYSNTFGKNNITILAGGTYQTNNNERSQMTGSGYINDELLGSISPAPIRNVSDGFNAYKYAAAFSRINYRFDNKYLINLTARRDGSSRFGPGNKFGNFGSLGVGWLLSEEQFVKDRFSFLSFGKLRGSYGTTGIDAIADYQYLSRWAATNYNYGDVIGYIPQNLFNPLLKWASTNKLEAGIELGFFQDKVLLTSAWYRNRSGNQLITYSLPSATGFASIASNWGAVVQNSGLEIMLQTSNIKKQSFTWSSTFNITVPKNELLEFHGIETSSYSTTYLIGQPVNTIFGFKNAGVNTETGIFQFFDKDGEITSTPSFPSGGNFNDYQNLGTLDPRFYGGLLNSLFFKGFQLDIFIDFRKQLGANYLYQVYGLNVPGAQLNQPAALLDRWQSPGDETNIQRFSAQYGEEYDAASNFFQSDGVYSDASYMRFRNIALSYSFGKNTLEKIRLSNLRIFCNAQNLFTITNYLGNDPETQSLYSMPVLKTMVFGLQLTL